MRLVPPSLKYLDSYRAALETGWSPRPARPEASVEELLAISKDPGAFLATLDDPEARGPDIQHSNGGFVKRLPSFRRWIWADGFCGSIELRWQNGTNALPPICSGQIGCAVVPWRRREGLATAALGALLPKARRIGLTAVDLTVYPSNIASVRVIEANGGNLVTRRNKMPAYSGEQELLYRIALAQ